MKIALDAMGGDYAPLNAIEGVKLAFAELPQTTKYILVGQQERIKKILKEKAINSSSIEVIDAEETIEMDENPAQAFSKKNNSSISKGLSLLQNNEVEVFCSAGNTGAVYLGAMLTLKPIEGVKRPAIATNVPNIDGSYSVLLDVGANADCKPHILNKFGELGKAYAESVLNIHNPRVALVNMGHESSKGTIFAKRAYKLLDENKCINFVGNIEGGEIFESKTDVLVTNGYTGNIILKLSESFYNHLKFKDISDTFVDELNYESVGGSPILGINGNIIIGHGISSSLAFKNMLLLAFKIAKSNLSNKIKEAINK